MTIKSGIIRRNVLFAGLGTLAVIVVVTLIGPHDTCLRDPMKHSRESQAAVRTVNDSLLKFQEVNGRFPSYLSELVPKYIARVPLDAWGNELQYVKNAAPDVMVFSLGQDGHSGGSGVDADIYKNSNLSVVNVSFGGRFACWE